LKAAGDFFDALVETSEGFRDEPKHPEDEDPEKTDDRPEKGGN